MARSKLKMKPFHCVSCEQDITPLSSHDAPTSFDPSVVKSGDALPGPHCRSCKERVLKASAKRFRDAARKREEDRALSFQVPKPSDVSDWQWSVMRSAACCPKARFSPCVCVYSFHCEEHGDTHVGSHD